MTKSHRTVSGISRKELLERTAVRPGETKLGEVIECFDGREEFDSFLSRTAAGGARFAVLGIPEDIGPRANLGRPGAGGAWDAFLSEFCNVQLNRYFDVSGTVLLGPLVLDDICEPDSKKSISTTELRKHCAELDERVEAVLGPIISAGFEPIVIGGGHNNALPLIRAVSKARHSGASRPVACCNLDSHADFREIEGRHSGNAFRYAFDEKLLASYFVLGARESYNNEQSLGAMKAAGFPLITHEELFVSRSISFESALDAACAYLASSSGRVGVELDLDSIESLPASSPAVGGFSINDGALYAFTLASRLPCAYLHLPEGAPTAANSEKRRLGRALVDFALAYLKGRARCLLL